MAEKQSSVGDAANGLGILAAIICFFIGFDKGAWVGGFITAAVAYGGSDSPSLPSACYGAG